MRSGKGMTAVALCCLMALGSSTPRLVMAADPPTAPASQPVAPPDSNAPPKQDAKEAAAAREAAKARLEHCRKYHPGTCVQQQGPVHQSEQPKR
jgi:hypothetical protein